MRPESDLLEKERGALEPWDHDQGKPVHVPESDEARQQDTDAPAYDREDLNRREEDPDNSMGYTPDEDASASERRATNKNKKGASKKSAKGGGLGRGKIAAIAGGAGGLGFGLVAMIGLFGMKIPAIGDMLQSATGTVIEHTVQRRVTYIVAHAIFERAGIRPGVVVTGGGPISMVTATLRTHRFEDRLAAKGLNIVYENDGVRLTSQGFDSGKLKDVDGIMKALDESRVSKAAMRSLVNENVPVYRFFYRQKLAKWLVSKWNIQSPKKTAANDDKEKSNADKEKAATTERVKLDTESSVKISNEMLDDTLKVLSSDPNNPLGDNADDIQRGASDTTKKAVEESAEDINKAAADKAGKEAAEAIAKTGTKVTAGAVLRAATSVYGWVTLYATVYSAFDVIWESSMDGTLSQKLAEVRGNALAKGFGDFSTLSAQYKINEHDPLTTSYEAAKLDGIERSYAFNCISKGFAAGCDEAGDQSGTRVNETKVVNREDIASTLASMTGIGESSADDVLSALDIATYQNRKLARVLFWLDASTVGVVINWLADGAGWVIENTVMNIPGVQDSLDIVKNWVEDLTTPVINQMLTLLGLSVDPLAMGSEKFSNLFSGGMFSSTKFCRDVLGCHDLSLAEGQQQYLAYQQEQSEYLQSKGALYALFSPEAPMSVTNKLAASSPSSVSGSTVLQTAASAIGSIPETLASFVTKSSKADSVITPASLAGMRETGFTESELSSSVETGVLYEDDFSCDNSDNPMCRVDQMITESIICMDPSKIESADCNPDAADSSSDGGSSDNTGDTGGGTGSAASGSAQDIAKQMLSNPNVSFTGGSLDGKADIQSVARTGKPLRCGTRSSNAGVSPNSMNAQLLGLLQGATKDWKIKIGVISGYHSCDVSHQAGNAVDLNGATAVDGSCSTSFSFGGDRQCIIKFSKYLDEMAASAGIKKLMLNQVGQGNTCGMSVPLKVTKGYSDGCHHLHVGIRK